jgi:hypothetical protein
VTNANDSGTGSLRQAILDSNGNAGPNTIAFNIGSGGAQTIQPTSALPSITNPAIIDGTTQPGFAGSPLIVLNGSKAGSSASGLTLTANGSTVRSLVVNGFGANGINIFSNDVLTGNYIGTDVTGTAAVPNIFGIYIYNGANNTVGGTTAADRNVISGNFEGVEVYYFAQNNRILGNYIGTDATGTKVVANKVGIDIYLCSGNTIGGTTAAERNLISGNTDTGVNIFRSGSPDNVVEGNYIGTDLTGTLALGNGTGVVLSSSTKNEIGGTVGGARNVISGNKGDGVRITISDNGDSADNVVQGNYIGTDLTGTQALPNATGVTIEGGGGNSSVNNTIGGTVTGAGNVIAGNTGSGIVVQNVNGNSVQGNRIGVDVSGGLALPNAKGVEVRGGASNNTIGGTASGARNIISGNSTIGVMISDGTSKGNTVDGDYIGTDGTGTKVVRNSYGIYISGAPNNVVGGSASGAGNLISGNDEGIVVFSASGTMIQGNFVGTDAAGTVSVGNLVDGISLLSGSGNTVGGTTAGARNVISGNPNNGVAVFAPGNTMMGNYIGTSANGTAKLANGTGVYISGSGNTVGGTVAGAANLISGNSVTGIALFGTDAQNNQVSGNLIGTDLAGTMAVANGVGVSIDSGTGNIIGGTTTAARNLISGNTGAGVLIRANVNFVQGNYVGTDSVGAKPVRNRYGVEIDSGYTGNVVGGTLAGAGNVLSGNQEDGVLANGSANLIQGNRIGTDQAGTAALGNMNAGIYIYQGSGNTIGGTVAGAGNLISGNTGANGVQIVSANDNVLQGNRIGTDASGTKALTQTRGVYVTNNGKNTVIGGTTSGAGNLISGNGTGISLSANDNVIQGNYIGTDVTGTLAVKNTGAGVSASGGNLIGGTAAGAGNLISGNGGAGISLSGANNQILDNRIGTDVTGTMALGNAKQGVTITSFLANTIGAPGAGNVISSNLGNAVETSSGTLVQANLIGTDITGTIALGNGGIGIYVKGGSNTIGGTATGAGNVVAASHGYGVYIYSSSNNAVQGNRIGTDITGTVGMGNLLDGVSIAATAMGNVIGGSTAAARKVIAANGGAGIAISDHYCSGNQVQGNYIGIDATGTHALGNQIGVKIMQGASANTIGGTVAGTGNVISGNVGDGVQIIGGGSWDTRDNLIAGNEIGTDAAGTSALGNQNGVLLMVFGSTHNTIGGTTATARNIISGNQKDGVSLLQVADQNVVQGNFIGSDVTGTHPLGNDRGIFDGCYLDTIGGSVAGAGNLISGNATGIFLSADAYYTSVQGNRIGTDVTGTLPVANAEGIIVSGSLYLTIGGTVSGAGNLVAGNLGPGITFTAGAKGDFIEGNLIGTNGAGTAKLGNQEGILIDLNSPNNTIGGAVVGARNVISGNLANGLTIRSSTNVVQGNYIGTDITGTVALGNGQEGVSINATDNQIGGTVAGSGNLISGNTDGIVISDAGNIVQGNLIGTDLTGTIALGEGAGVMLVYGANNTIGGTGVAARNIISGTTTGIYLDHSPVNLVEGNFIGTDITGTKALGNTVGVSLQASSYSNMIGGTATGAGNVISGNTDSGVSISDSNSNVFLGNFIGTDFTATQRVANKVGVRIDAGSGENTVGGTTPGARNLISANDDSGVTLYGNGNTVEGNWIGTDITGTLALGNLGSGVVVLGGSSNAIGGVSSAAGNVIAFNGYDGVLIEAGTDNGVRHNVIVGHDVGLGIELTNGGNNNQAYPILTSAISDSSSTTIEGSLASAPSTRFTIEFFSDTVCNPSGYGEGEHFLGFVSVTTDADGNASFTFTVAIGVDPGQFISATATDPGNNTSAFAACVEVTAPVTAFVARAALVGTESVGSNLAASLANVVVAPTLASQGELDLGNAPPLPCVDEAGNQLALDGQASQDFVRQPAGAGLFLQDVVGVWQQSPDSGF